MAEDTASTIEVACLRGPLLEITQGDPDDLLERYGLQLNSGNELGLNCTTCRHSTAVRFGRAFAQLPPDPEVAKILSSEPDCAQRRIAQVNASLG